MSYRFTRPRVPLAVLPAALFAVAFVSSATTQAAPIGNPSEANFWDTTSAVTLSDYSGERDTSGSADGAATRKVINLINGTGISGASGDLHAQGSPFSQMAMFASLPGGAGDSGTFGMPGVFGTPNPGTLQGSSSHWVEFQFDQVYSLTDIAIWNYNENTWYVQGWKNIVVQVSQTGGESAADWTTVFTGELPLSPGAGASPSAPAKVIPVAGVSAKYVTLINTGLGDDATWLAGDDGSHAGLSEIRFNSGLLAPVAGDLDGDFDVDLLDYGVLTSNWLQTVPVNTMGDLNADTVVNIRDFGLFKDYYNDFNGIGSAEALSLPVPEPATLALLTLSLPAVLVWRRLKRDR